MQKQACETGHIFFRDWTVKQNCIWCRQHYSWNDSFCFEDKMTISISEPMYSNTMPFNKKIKRIMRCANFKHNARQELFDVCERQQSNHCCFAIRLNKNRKPQTIGTIFSQSVVWFFAFTLFSYRLKLISIPSKSLKYFNLVSLR